jgi:hypothetical protein
MIWNYENRKETFTPEEMATLRHDALHRDEKYPYLSFLDMLEVLDRFQNGVNAARKKLHRKVRLKLIEFEDKIRKFLSPYLCEENEGDLAIVRHIVTEMIVRNYSIQQIAYVVDWPEEAVKKFKYCLLNREVCLIHARGSRDFPPLRLLSIFSRMRKTVTMTDHIYDILGGYNEGEDS